MKTLQRMLLTLALLVGAGAIPAKAQIPMLTQTTDPSKSDYYWYGVTLRIPLFFTNINIHIPGTKPMTKWTTDYFGIPASGKYPGQNLTNNASYHNATMYWHDTLASNAIRTTLWQQYVGASAKESGPLTGRSPTSLSFWEWIKVGEMSLKTYGKIRAIMEALKSGHIEINAWRLMPKVGILDEDDPEAPALMLGIMPAGQGPLAMIKEMTDWSDPRYRLSNKVRLSNLKGLVPSLAVKPSFYGALVHYQASMGASNTSNQMVMARLQKNFHELRTSLSMIQRQVAGGPYNPYKRWTVMNQAEDLNKLLIANSGSWNDIANQITAGISLVNPGAAAAWKAANGPAFGAIAKLQQDSVRDNLARRGADDFAAHAISAEENNLTYPLESDEYMKFIDDVETMVEEGASSKAVINQGDEALAELRIEGADAGVNRLLRDEFRAIRQLYAIKARRELNEKLAPNIAMGLRALREGADRMKMLERRVTRLQEGQTAASKVLSAGDAAKMLAEPFVL